jgi:hypothetical protein
MPGLVPGIHVLAAKTWMAGPKASEATPFFERLGPAMTKNLRLFGIAGRHFVARQPVEAS